MKGWMVVGMDKTDIDIFEDYLLLLQGLECVRTQGMLWGVLSLGTGSWMA